MLRWIVVIGLALVGMLIVTTVLITYSQVGSASDARTYQYCYRPLQMGTQIEIVHEGSRLGPCSLGFPAYYERAVRADLIAVYYGVIIASHCGLQGDSVYQSVTRSNNYIGYMRNEGRFTLGELLANPWDVDAT